MRNRAMCFLAGSAIFLLASGVHAAEKLVPVCHKEKTIWVAPEAVDAHVGHGDDNVRCQDRFYSGVTIFRCGVSSENDMVVTAASLSFGTPLWAPQIAVDDDCAEANAALLDAGYQRKQVESGPVGEDFETEYYYEQKFVKPEFR